MPKLLFLSHRTPFPPDKGEKIRGFNILKHLSQTHSIHLGCLMDSPEDPGHLETLRQWCTEVAGFRIDNRKQKLTALTRYRPGRPLMLDYYHNAELQRWVGAQLAANTFDIVYVFSVAMRPYVETVDQSTVVLDAIDIDSEKWTTYAETARYPMSLVWAREGRTFLVYEKRSVLSCAATLFVSPQETARFEELAPETKGRVHPVENGVDLVRFSCCKTFDTPYFEPGPHLSFTGHMDYWPNIDAVIWFATEVMPLLYDKYPTVKFHVVGANPTDKVRRLKSIRGVTVTGRVPDVRPYIAHSNACVAPLRIARGIQNKVLEAMAMGKPVVASPAAFQGVRAIPGQDLLVAEGPIATAGAILEILAGHHPDLGQAGRRAVERVYAWPATLARLDAVLRTLPAVNEHVQS